MGGCTSKPKTGKDRGEGEAAPVHREDQPPPADIKKGGREAWHADEAKRHSLGILFHQDDELKCQEEEKKKEEQTSKGKMKQDEEDIPSTDDISPEASSRPGSSSTPVVAVSATAIVEVGEEAKQIAEVPGSSSTPVVAVAATATVEVGRKAKEITAGSGSSSIPVVAVAATAIVEEGEEAKEIAERPGSSSTPLVAVSATAIVEEGEEAKEIAEVNKELVDSTGKDETAAEEEK